MKEFLYLVIDIFTAFHTFFVALRDRYGIALDDKQLHFFIIGFLCLFIYIIAQFIFKRMAKWKISSVTFIYTFTIAIVITFAIEIGQWKTNTGNIELADVMYGMYGFLVIFFCYQLLIMIVKFLYRFVKRLVKNEDKDQVSPINHFD